MANVTMSNLKSMLDIKDGILVIGKDQENGLYTAGFGNPFEAEPKALVEDYKTPDGAIRALAKKLREDHK